MINTHTLIILYFSFFFELFLALINDRRKRPGERVERLAWPLTVDLLGLLLLWALRMSIRHSCLIQLRVCVCIYQGGKRAV